MKRSQKEIKMICEEIQLAVKMAILREEAEKRIREIQQIQHEFTLCYDPVSGAYFKVSEEMIKAQIATLNLHKKFKDYKQKVIERL